MGVNSIFNATINEVPPELEEQVNDFQLILDSINNYSRKHDVTMNFVISDIMTIYGG